MQRIDIGLHSVTSFAWSTFGTAYTRAIFQVDGKTLLSIHVLMTWTSGEVTSSITGFKYRIGVLSWPIEQSICTADSFTFWFWWWMISTYRGLPTILLYCIDLFLFWESIYQRIYKFIFFFGARFQCFKFLF